MIFFKIYGIEPNDFEERVFPISQGKNVLAGIRHAGGNIEKPFINLWPDFEFTSLSEFNEVYGVLAGRFNLFTPKHLSFWLNPISKFAQELEASISPNLRYIVAPVSKIKQNKKPSNYDKIALVPVKDSSYRGWYEELYKDFHSQNEELKDWVPVNDEEDMDKCLRDQLLFFVHVDGKKAGVIGGRKEGLLGELGVYFTDIVLSAEFKGKGFATAVQRIFIEQLPGEIKVIWGTIDSKNVSSTKTALRVGRVPVRNEFFLPIDHLK